MRIVIGYSLMLFMVLLLAAGAPAEYYQYTDEDGNLHFTDDMTNVPEDKMPEATSFESTNKRPARSSRDGDNAGAYTKPKASPYTWDGRLRIKVKDLDKEKAELDRTFSELQKQKAELRQKDPEKMSPAERRDYNARIRELNERIKRYDKQREAFEEKVDRTL